jgi:hypothetical protein
MPKFNKISEMSEQELNEVGVSKTDWYVIAKETASYIDNHPKTKGFTVWLSEKMKIPENAAQMLRSKIRNLELTDIKNWQFKGANDGSLTKIYVKLK